MSFKTYITESEEYRKRDLFDIPPKFKVGETVIIDKKYKLTHAHHLIKNHIGKVSSILLDKNDKWTYTLLPIDTPKTHFLIRFNEDGFGQYDVDFPENDLSKG
jgi:hypothetical protein